MAKYKSRHTGEQIDNGVDAALNPDAVVTEGSDALITSGAAFDAIEQEGAKLIPIVGKGINLLDNWYFLNPINQRGQSSYSGSGYSIDRWFGHNSNATLTINNGYITVTHWMRQFIENGIQNLAGKLATASMLFGDDTFYSGSATILANGTAMFFNDGVNLLYTYGDNSALSFLYERRPDTVCTLKAFKLELGPEQTLAHYDATIQKWVLNDPPPNYQQELAKCQRYFYKTGGDFKIRVPQYIDKRVWFGLPLPVQMRALPTSVTISGHITLYTPTASQSQSASSVSAQGSVSASGIELLATFPNNAYDGFLIVNNLLISAEL